MDSAEVEADAALASADFNADGIDDLIAVGDETWIHYGPFTGASSAKATMLTTGTAGTPLLEDVTQDGLIDLVLPRDERVTIYYGNFAEFSSSNAVDLTTPTYQAGTAVTAIGDINGDGWPEVVTGYHHHCCTGDSRVFWGAAQGFATTNQTAFVVESTTFGLHVGDIDNTGYDDVVHIAGHTVGSRSLMFGSDLSGIDPTGTPIPTDPTVFPRGTELVDFDSDGDLDLFISSGTSWNGRYVERVLGGWLNHDKDFPGFASGESTFVHDFNDDGYPDLYHQQSIYYSGPAGLAGTTSITLGLGDFSRPEPRRVIAVDPR